MPDEKLDKIIQHWASEKELVARDAITDLEYEIDTDVFPGTDVTPAEPIEMVITYTVTKKVVKRIPVNEMGPWIIELSDVARRGSGYR